MAEEAHTRLRIAETKAGAGLIGRVGRRRTDCRGGRWRCNDSPTETSGCTLIAYRVLRFDGTLIHHAAHHGRTSDEVESARRAFPQPPGRGSVTARALLSRSVVQIADVLEFDNADKTRLNAKIENKERRIIIDSSLMALRLVGDRLPVSIHLALHRAARLAHRAASSRNARTLWSERGRAHLSDHDAKRQVE